MFSFAEYIDLPLIWGGIIATAVLLYVLLDGFDLGVGILFPFAPSDQARNRMMNSIAPFWDGNETWLVLGGGGLFAAFPLAYSIVMPALYIPVILMLICLIFRGVAFEFRFKADTSRQIWDYAFHFGSLGAAFFQGLILGGIVQGITIENRSFAGGPFDWLSGFSVMTGFGVVAGYALLGACWVFMKGEGDLQAWASKCAKYVFIYVLGFMGLVSLWVPFLDNDLDQRWFGGNNIYYLSPIPILTGILFFALWKAINMKGSSKHHIPFFLTLAIFLMGYLGLAVSLWPTIVPYDVTIWQAAAAPESLSLMLVGVVIMLPVILAYTGWCYYVFRGKTDDSHGY
ncbi:MAG: cytochrome d ubiquinol oxidase subunit II [Micavibrio aeruginosavorus]|uniref:Cytochrome d ubiquinol oxidase subunit II n=1 Tax=Micavibrio aeruginosavorus TaxID=349221 RepID=A0A2W5Q785_9BACT|nr:MAG: cytochrome d ubiquinol oxidase subunit II [Micavibrio aeruginosavorus]